MTLRKGSQAAMIPEFLAGYQDSMSAEISHDPSPASRTPLRILLIEDDANAAELFAISAAQSELFAIDVTYCGGWERAVSAIAASDFDVLVIDLWLNNATTIPIIESFAEAGRGKPVIILSNQTAGDVGSIENLTGATGMLCRSDVSGEALDAILLRMRQTSGQIAGGSDLIAPSGRDGSSEFTENLKDVMLSLDAVHAHAAVASGALLKGNPDEISELLAHTIESAAAARKTLFGLVSELQRQQVEHAPTYGVTEASQHVGDAVELLEHDAEVREVGLVFRPPSRAVWVECDEGAFRHMVETLLASVVWKAESRTSVQISMDAAERFELKMRYQSSREIRIVDACSGDAAIHAALSDLDRQASKFGGIVSVEPEGKYVVARLNLPARSVSGKPLRRLDFD